MCKGYSKFCKLEGSKVFSQERRVPVSSPDKLGVIIAPALRDALRCDDVTTLQIQDNIVM
jgi:hypothetical protein